MNCTEYYTKGYYTEGNSYANGFFVIITLFNTIYLYLINNNINCIKKDIKEQSAIKPPNYTNV